VAKRSEASRRTSRSLNSKRLKQVMKRVRSSELPGPDKAVLIEILEQAVKMKQLVERSTQSRAGKKVVVTLPFGFDIVK
jgi:hypothetical protein